MIVYLAVALVSLLLVGAAYDAWRYYTMQLVRQDLYRLRDRIFDRAIEGELDIRSENVRHLVGFVHGLLFVFDNWSFFLFVCAALRAVKDGPSRQPWMEDETLKSEVGEAFECAARGFRAASPVVTWIARIVTPVAKVIKWLSDGFAKALCKEYGSGAAQDARRNTAPA